MSDELKPCPFCGEPPSCNDVHMGGPRPTDTYRCRMCRVSKTAVEWNKRAEPDQLKCPACDKVFGSDPMLLWAHGCDDHDMEAMYKRGQQALELLQEYVQHSRPHTEHRPVWFSKAKALLEKEKP